MEIQLQGCVGKIRELRYALPMRGVNHRATKNQKATIRAVMPVRPPLRMPVADSANAGTTGSASTY